MSLQPEEVADILALLDSLGMEEFELTTSRFTLALRRTTGGWTRSEQVFAPPGPRPGPDAPAPEAGARAAAGPETEGRAAAGPAAALHPVPAPLPGTFYRAPSPGAATFVEVGTRVQETTVIGIVETMKLMNPVAAGVHGRVAQICVADAEAVTTGTVLVTVDTRAGDPAEGDRPADAAGTP